MFKSLKSKFTKKNDREIFIKSPVEGEAVAMSTVNDPTFSEEMLGKGIAIKPSVGKVVSPVDGEITVLFDTKHAVAIKGNNGVEILIHIGLDTVNLKGEHFTSYVKVGQSVKIGQTLMEFDIEKIKQSGYDTITPIIICNTHEFVDVKTIKIGEVNTQENVLEIIKN